MVRRSLSRAESRGSPQVEALEQPFHLGDFLLKAWSAPHLKQVEYFLNSRGIAYNEPLAAMHPLASSTQKWKEWPLQNYRPVIEWLIKKQNTKTILLGTENEKRELAPLIDHPPQGLISAVGELSTFEMLALLSRCRVFIGIDSGPAHLAVSQGTPTVRIFGPTDPESFKAWKETGKHREVYIDIDCRPCLVAGTFKPGVLNASNCQHRNCLMKLDSLKVIRAVESCLQGTEAVPAHP